MSDAVADAPRITADMLEQEAVKHDEAAARIRAMARELLRHFGPPASRGGYARAANLTPEQRSEASAVGGVAKNGKTKLRTVEPDPEQEPAPEPPCNRIPVPATVYRVPSAITTAPAVKDAPSAVPEARKATVAAGRAPSAMDLAELRAEAAAEDAKRNPRKPEPVEEYAPGFGPNQDWEPDCEQSIHLGKKLSNPFTPMDLQARLDADRQGHSPASRSYLWIANWKRHGWLESAGYGQHRKTERFGERSAK